MNSSLEFNRYCRVCLHSLRGVMSDRCPECGGAFDPLDSRTTNAHPWLRFWDVLATIARQVTVVILGFTAFSIVYSALGYDPLWLLLPAFAAVHVILFTLFAAVTPAIPLTWRWRVTGVGAVAVVVSVLFTQWPLRVTFMMHRPWLESIVEEVRTTGTIETPRQVGVFRFQRIILNDRGSIGFKLTGKPGNGLHLVLGTSDYRHGWANSGTLAELGGNWYLVDED